MIFYLCSYSDFCHLTFLIIGSHIVFISILGLLSRVGFNDRCGNNNKDEDNSPKTLNDKNNLPLSSVKYSN